MCSLQQRRLWRFVTCGLRGGLGRTGRTDNHNSWGRPGATSRVQTKNEGEIAAKKRKEENTPKKKKKLDTEQTQTHDEVGFRGLAAWLMDGRRGRGGSGSGRLRD